MVPPKAAFCGGTRRTPQKVRRSLSEFTEAHESERRRKLAGQRVDTRQPPWKMEMAARMSRNRSGTAQVVVPTVPASLPTL